MIDDLTFTRQEAGGTGEHPRQVRMRDKIPAGPELGANEVEILGGEFIVSEYLPGHYSLHAGKTGILVWMFRAKVIQAILDGIRALEERKGNGDK